MPPDWLPFSRASLRTVCRGLVGGALAAERAFEQRGRRSSGRRQGRSKAGRLARGMRTRRASVTCGLNGLGSKATPRAVSRFAHVARQPFELRRRCDAQPQRRSRSRGRTFPGRRCAARSGDSARAGLFQGVDGGGDLRLADLAQKGQRQVVRARREEAPFQRRLQLVGKRRRFDGEAFRQLQCDERSHGGASLHGRQASDELAFAVVDHVLDRARRSNLRRFSCGARARRPPALRRSP